ncbi:MAG: hypothetical protein R2874_12730 [Desulfobacterales bacterium]
MITIIPGMTCKSGNCCATPAKSGKAGEKDANNIEALHYAGLAYTYLGRMDAHQESIL